MKRIRKPVVAVLALSLLTGLIAAPASAFVEALYSLKQVMDESYAIVEAEIASVDQKERLACATVKGVIKGKCPFKQLKLNIGVGQAWFPEVLLKRLKVGEPVLFFWNEGLECLAYQNGHFFQFRAEAKPDPNAVWWNFTHIEIKMNRTYKGETAELIAIVRDVVAGKRAPPPPDPKVPPFTREELLGLVERADMPPLSPTDEPDELEAWLQWKVENWGRPATATIAYSAPAGAAESEILPGLLAEYYVFTDELKDFPVVSGRKPDIKRVDKQINFEAVPFPGTTLKENFYTRWTGFVRIPKEGRYKFSTVSDDGSLFFVDGNLVVDNGGEHGAEEKGSHADLSAGDHAVRLEFFQGGGDACCKLLWEGPDIAKETVPAAALFHRTVGSRGQMLRIEFAEATPDRNKDKVAVSRKLDADWSQAGRLLYEACNQSAAPIKVAWGFTTMPGEQYYESPQVELPPGRWFYGLQANFGARNFKSQSAQWKYSSAIENLGKVIRICVLIYNAPNSGALLLDRVRPDANSFFVRSIPLASAGGKVGSVSWADYDGDGKLDALVCTEAGLRLFRNSAGEFSDVSSAVFPPAVLNTKGSYGAAWADYDGDGQVDLLLTTPALLHNENGKFTLQHLPVGAQNQPAPQNAGWLDARGNGRPDILLSGKLGTLLLLNSGPGPERFVSADKTWGALPGAAPVYGGLSIADFDGDGFSDILCHQGKGLLFHNEEGKSFRQVPEPHLDYNTAQPLGAAWGDYDNDGSLDLFVPQNGKCCLFRNNKDNTFTNVIETSGDLAKIKGNARTAVWGDVNLDGNLDLIVGFSDGSVRVYLGDGKGKFKAQPPLNSFGCARGATGMALADLEGDGRLSLLVCGENSAGILVNAAPRVPDGPVPLRVRLHPSQAPGSLVRLYDMADKPLGVRQVGLITNFNSQEPQEALFAVKPGKYKVSILFTNGQTKQAAIVVDENGFLLKINKQ
ncbi:MAG: FG-GAP-like repeat-containing protein [Planctomycetota bacterium]